MTRMIRRLLAVVILSTVFMGMTAPIADASMAWCPFITLFGKRYEICIPIP